MFNKVEKGMSPFHLNDSVHSAKHTEGQNLICVTVDKSIGMLSEHVLWWIGYNVTYCTTLRILKSQDVANFLFGFIIFSPLSKRLLSSIIYGRRTRSGSKLGLTLLSYSFALVVNEYPLCIFITDIFRNETLILSK